LMLSASMSYIAFIMLRYIPSVPRFFSFYHEMVLNLIIDFFLHLLR
jgi:hypothetical protein